MPLVVEPVAVKQAVKSRYVIAEWIFNKFAFFTDFSQGRRIFSGNPQLREDTWEKEMNQLSHLIAAALLLLLPLFACGQASASTMYEYYADARMQHADAGLVKDAYGYVEVITDKKGHGVIHVMFSNGTKLDRLGFNAQVKFLDADGVVVREEWFERRIEAADSLGAGERKVTKLLDLNEFASMQVEFFLTDMPVSAIAGLQRSAAESRN